MKDFLKRLRELLDSVSDETPADETPADETPADETPADETPADETPAAETPADETPADETPADETPADETPADEGTPGAAETGDANVADLRATITQQAAQIETYRNLLATAGIEVEDIEGDEVLEDELEDKDEADMVAEFDRDYAEREALLKEITGKG